MMEPKKITKKDGLLILGQQVPLALASIAPVLIGLPAGVQAALLLGSSMIQTWGAFGEARTGEIVEELSKHNNDEFVAEVIASDKFKSVFLNVLEAHIKETMSDKRQLYRNYLINVAKGVHADFDYHSKLLTVLNLITFDEIRTLQALALVFDVNGGDTGNHGAPYRPTVRDLYMRLKTKGEEYEGGQPAMLLNMRLLQTYNLIFTVEARDTDTNALSLSLESITDFGSVFLDFINVPETDTTSG